MMIVLSVDASFVAGVNTATLHSNAVGGASTPSLTLGIVLHGVRASPRTGGGNALTLLGGCRRRLVCCSHPEITPLINFHHLRDTTRHQLEFRTVARVLSGHGSFSSKTRTRSIPLTNYVQPEGRTPHLSLLASKITQQGVYKSRSYSIQLSPKWTVSYARYQVRSRRPPPEG